MGRKRPLEDVASAVPSAKKLRSNGYPLPQKAPLNTRISSQNLPPLPKIDNPELRSQVFTHESLLSDASKLERVLHSYERLELLGDAYIEVIAARLVFSKYPNMTAGRLSQTRENLIKNESLAIFAQMYGFDQKLKLAKETSERAYARGQWIKVMGDVMEAYVAGIILSDPGHGFNRAEEWLNELWTPLLPPDEQPADNMAKQKLAMQLGGKGVKMDYLEDQAPANDNKRGMTTYTIGVYLTGWGCTKHRLGVAQGLSKSEAGQRAATNALANPELPKLVEIKKQQEREMSQGGINEICGTERGSND